MKNRHHDISIFTSSVVGNFLGIVSGAALASWALYMIVYVGSGTDIYTQMFLERTNAITLPDQVMQMADYINNSEVAADIAVFCLWGAVGVLMYVLGMLFFNAYQAGKGALEAVSLSSIEDRPFVVESIVVRSLLRLAGVFGLFLLYQLARLLIPFLLVWFGRLQRREDIMLIVVTTIVLFVLGYLTVYVTVLCVRLLVLRPRVFRGPGE